MPDAFVLAAHCAGRGGGRRGLVLPTTAAVPAGGPRVSAKCPGEGEGEGEGLGVELGFGVEPG